jgi:hypothetical protein
MPAVPEGLRLSIGLRAAEVELSGETVVRVRCSLRLANYKL